MKIAVFSMTPLFENQIMGGSQQVLKDITIHLGDLGHDVTIYSTKRWDTRLSFKWHKKVTISPVFDFKQPYPDPYATKPYSIASAISDLGMLIANSERLYLHDSAFPFPYVYKNIPTVGSLPDVVYSETLIGSFTFSGNNLIVPSEHTREVYLSTVGRFFPELADRLSVIHNGFDFDLFKNSKFNKLYRFIPKQVFQHEYVILHPHRPEPSKGLDITINVVERLVGQGFKNLITLVPLWIETDNNIDLQTYYLSMRKIIHDKGLDEHFYFHPWLDRNLMPEYFSAGSVMFSFGSYVETFGNAVYEAIGCGTPVVVANRGPHRITLPNKFADKVEPDNIRNIALKVSRILREHRHFNKNQLSEFKSQFSIERMVDSYADKIIHAQVASPMRYIPEAIHSDTLLTLAPWIINVNHRLINEFNVDEKFYTDFPKLVAVINRGATVSQILTQSKNLSMETIQSCIKNGWIVPHNTQ